MTQEVQASGPKDIHAHLTLKQGLFMLDAAFSAPAVGVTALFGPSGSGKTTLLRCIAGLEHATGSLHINGDVWQDNTHNLPTHKRKLGYVFQEASLFPHLSVRANLEYGLKRTPLVERRLRLAQVVEWLGLTQLLDRRSPASLSGGERQRVAMGRALLTSPRLLLMDEPLSALDSASKQEILPYLEILHRELEIPVLYVSHSLDEVARLADHLVAMEKGKVIACGPLGETLSRLDLPLAHFDDASTVIETVVGQTDPVYKLAQLNFTGGVLWTGQLTQPSGHKVRVRVLARDVSIATQQPQGSSITNILPARITEICIESSDKVNVRMLIGDTQVLLSRITHRSLDLLQLSVGMQVYAQVKCVALMA